MNKQPPLRTACWLAPCASGTLTRSVIHFFPAARGVSAPYAAECRLTLFMGADGVVAAPDGSSQLTRTTAEEYSVMLEGARLSQPDGLWLDDAFPILKESTRSAGLTIEISSESSKADLSVSGCVMEFHSGFNLCRFFPAVMHTLMQHTAVARQFSQELPNTALMIDDQQLTTTLMIVNRSGEEVQPSVDLVCPAAGEQAATAALLPIERLGVSSVTDFDVGRAARSQLLVHRPKHFQASFGDTLLGTLRFRQPLPDGCVPFVVYRDSKNRQPISIRPFRGGTAAASTFSLANP